MQEHGRFIDISLLGFLSLHPDHGDGGTGSELWLCCICLLTTCVSLQVAFTSYGDQSKRQRRLLHQAFGIQAIPAYYPLLQIETVAFLRRLAADPSKYESHTRRYAGGLTLSVVYGYEVKSSEDELLQLAEECVDLLANHIASGCGIWPVDIIPALQYLPDWVPGSGFKRKAAKWKVKFEELVEKPYEYVKNSVVCCLSRLCCYNLTPYLQAAGNYKNSFCSTLLEDDKSKVNEEFEFDLKWTANSMYSASIDTVRCLYLPSPTSDLKFTLRLLQPFVTLSWQCSATLRP